MILWQQKFYVFVLCVCLVPRHVSCSGVERWCQRQTPFAEHWFLQWTFSQINDESHGVVSGMKLSPSHRYTTQIVNIDDAAVSQRETATAVTSSRLKSWAEMNKLLLSFAILFSNWIGYTLCALIYLFLGSQTIYDSGHTLLHYFDETVIDSLVAWVGCSTASGGKNVPVYFL